MIATYQTNLMNFAPGQFAPNEFAPSEYGPEKFAVPGSLTTLEHLGHRIRQSWDAGLLVDETDSELLSEFATAFLADGSYLADGSAGALLENARAENARTEHAQAVEEPGTAFLATKGQAFQMRCECLQESNLFDLVDHVFRLRQQLEAASDEESGENRFSTKASGPILIYVTDYQEAVEIDRCLELAKFRTHLASPFSNWTGILGKLGTGQLDVIISTTTEIPYADQIPWQAIYLPSTIHLAMLTTPELDWLGNYWFANHSEAQPPHLVVRRTQHRPSYAAS